MFFQNRERHHSMEPLPERATVSRSWPRGDLFPPTEITKRNTPEYTPPAFAAPFIPLL